jgi:carboxymethylenebutenolidase
MKACLPVAAVLLLLAPSLPAQDWAKATLEKSPRHGEWVKIPSGVRTLRAFVVYPEVAGDAPVILVVHEIFGMTDWVRDLADQIAAAGCIAIVPDLLSGVNYDGIDGAREAISHLPPDQITRDLKATIAYARELPAAKETVAVAGFCWGGGEAFRFATNDRTLAAAYVFYGPPPESSSDLARLHAPVYGFYGQDDARITATVPATEAAMKAAGKIYDPVIYPGAGHGFMRLGEAPDATSANKAAREKAWKRLKSLLGKLQNTVTATP